MKLGKNYQTFVRAKKMVKDTFDCLLGQLGQKYITHKQGYMHLECLGWKKGITECPNKKVCKELFKIIRKRS